MPLTVDVVTPDYHLYLYVADKHWYAVVEVDYLSGMPGIVKEIESSFPVKVNGWCVLTDYQKDAGTDLLSPDADDNDPDGTNDSNHNNYVHTIHFEHGMRYALLRVTPNPGVTVKEFGLSYFADKAASTDG